MVYIIPFLAVIFGAIKYEVCKHRDDGKFIIWLGLYTYLVAVIGFRYMVGGDSYVYFQYFNDMPREQISNISWDSDYQPGFVLLMTLCKLVYPSFTSFQLIHALIINTCLFYFIAKESKYRFTTMFLCFLIFYINFSVEILRESLAIMVFIFNYKNLESKKWFRYYVGALVAITFHISAVFLLILPIFKILRLNKTYIALLFIAFLALNQLQFLFTFFENVEKINKKITDYAEASYGWKSTLLFFATRTIIPIGLFYWAKHKYKMKVRYEFLMCTFGLLGICSIFNTIIFTRFTNYIMIFYCVALADVLIVFFQSRKSTVSRAFIYFTFSLILITYSYFSFYWPDRYYQKWWPYYSIFSEESQNGKFIDRDY